MGDLEAALSGPSGEPRTSERWATLAALAIAAGIALLYTRPFLGLAWRRGLTWPIRLAGEGPSLSTYGKWWVLPPHRYLTDGFTGEFPTFYNYLSDAILNALSAPFGWPPMTVQAVLYGPLLGSFLFLAVFATVRALRGDGTGALLAALLVSLGVSSGIPRLVPGLDVGELERVLHTPFHTVSLGTAQSLGWVLFLPTLGLFYLAFEEFTPRRALGFGILTGLLAHVHTLTLLNVGLVQVAWLTVRRFRESSASKRVSGRAVPFLVILGFAVRAVLGPPLSVRVLAILAVTLIALAFLTDRDRRPYVWGYGAATLVVAPYALALLRGASGLASIAEEASATSIPFVALLAFYAAYVAAASVAIARAPDRRLVLFLIVVLATTLLLAYNHLWNWGNHPYRFAIHLLFPLALLAAQGLQYGPRPARLALGAWFVAVMVANLARFAGGERIYATERVVVEDTADYLRRVREVTTAEATGRRLLNPPEFHYPIGLTQDALVFNYSARPGFLPDYRYLLLRERYYNRLALFCFLFPGYPAYDYHLGRRACTEPLDPPSDLVTLREPRLRAALLPAYRIDFAVASGKPFGEYLPAVQESYGWPTAVGEGLHRLVRTPPPTLPGLARFEAADDEGRAVPFEVDAGGPHLLVLAARGLAERVPRVLVDGQEVLGPRRGNWGVLRADLAPGRHRLELVTAGLDREGERDLLYFASIVAESRADAYLELPVPAGDGDRVVGGVTRR